MMFYAPQQGMMTSQFRGQHETQQQQSAFTSRHSLLAPAAIGAVSPTNMSAASATNYYNPTMVQYGPAQGMNTGYYPQPQMSQMSHQQAPVAVKRHNPYAAGAPQSASSSTTSYPGAQSESSGYSGRVVMMPDTSMMVDAFPAEQHGKFAAGQHHHPISTEELLNHQGSLAELSRTAPGSSFIQAALKEGSPYTQQNAAIIACELLPAASTLLLDAHGCYVIKTLMERLPADSLQSFVYSVTHDHQLIYSMCTHSLHTRRVVQYLMDIADVTPVADVLIQRCREVSMTQQGCIIMQRAMDVTPEPLRAQLFSTIFDHILEFAVDPFANYVVQHMLEIGDKELCSSAVLRAFRGNIVRLACNKFASNVMEKSLFHILPDAQHDLLHEMYEVDEEVLHAMLQDSFGNYFIQSSIALASFKDVVYINERLRSVLQRTPYGHKIELRIERRLKGRPVGTRSSQIGANSKTSRQQRSSTRDGAAEQSEEPW